MGEGRWICVLTADHGMAQATEQRLADGLPARRLEAEEIEEALASLRSRLGEPDVVAERLETLDYIAAVYTPDTLESGSASDPYLELYRHSWRPDRVRRIPFFSLVEGDAPHRRSGPHDPLDRGHPHGHRRRESRLALRVRPKGTLVLLGPDVEPGTSSAPACTVDVAPTLAALLDVPAPSRLDGRVLPTR